MPYVDDQSRADLELVSLALKESPPATAGELQYVIARAIAEFMDMSDKRYQDMNDVMGALSGAQQEFYRRVVAPYEDSCIKRNGDIPKYIN
jgi:hypothetical protein